MKNKNKNIAMSSWTNWCLRGVSMHFTNLVKWNSNTKLSLSTRSGQQLGNHIHTHKAFISALALLPLLAIIFPFLILRRFHSSYFQPFFFSPNKAKTLYINKCFYIEYNTPFDCNDASLRI